MRSSKYLLILLICSIGFSQKYDPKTGELINQEKYDPVTGEPIKATQYDPVTGEPIDDTSKPDSMFNNALPSTPLINLGDNVTKGQVAGVIWSLKEPWKKPTVLKFNNSGIVFCKRNPALCNIGDALFITLEDY